MIKFKLVMDKYCIRFFKIINQICEKTCLLFFNVWVNHSQNCSNTHKMFCRKSRVMI